MEVKYKTVKRERTVVEEVDVPELFEWHQKGSPVGDWFDRYFAVKSDSDNTTVLFIREFDFILSPESTVNMFEALRQFINSSKVLRETHEDKFGTVSW